MQIASILIFITGLYEFMAGVVSDSLIEMLLGTICLLLAAIIFPVEP